MVQHRLTLFRRAFCGAIKTMANVSGNLDSNRHKYNISLLESIQVYDCPMDRRSTRHTGGQHSFANNSIYGCLYFFKKQIYFWHFHFDLDVNRAVVRGTNLWSSGYLLFAINDLWGNIEMETTKRNHLQFCLLEHTCSGKTFFLFNF